MLIFGIIAGLGAVLVTGLMVWPLLRRRADASEAVSADAQVFRDQLAEIDRDLDRGTISAAEAEGARVEVSRRLLAAADRAERATSIGLAPGSTSRMMAIIALIATPALAAVFYSNLGAPGLPDLPLADRPPPQAAQETPPSQAEAEEYFAEQGLPEFAPANPEVDAMIERLREVVAQRPDDVEGHQLLARTLGRRGKWAEARAMQDRVMELLGEEAGSEDHSNHAEAMIFAAGGYVSPEAGQALANALRADGSNQMARYYIGFALRQRGRPDAAIGLWEELLQEEENTPMPRGDAWRDALVAVIAETRALLDAPGPSREQVEDAASMSPEERQEMIMGMVSRLETRLTENGGEPEEWVRLIRAYVQLERRDDALRIFALSQEALPREGGAGFVREQALLMGLELP